MGQTYLYIYKPRVDFKQIDLNWIPLYYKLKLIIVIPGFNKNVKNIVC